MSGTTDARIPRVRHTSRAAPSRPIVILAVMLVVGCSGRESESPRARTAAPPGGDSAVAAGHGRIHLTGDATLDTDFTVEQCAIGPAGAGLLNGYHMSARGSHGTLEMLSVIVKDYERDGTFSPAPEAAKTSVMGKRVLAGPLTMMVNRSNTTVPLAVIPGPESRITITISDGGASGNAEFSDLTSPIAMEDIDIKSRGRAKGKSFAGSLRWRCASVEHVDSGTTDAANSMMKGLTPIH